MQQYRLSVETPDGWQEVPIVGEPADDFAQAAQAPNLGALLMGKADDDVLWGLVDAWPQERSIHGMKLSAGYPL